MIWKCRPAIVRDLLGNPLGLVAARRIDDRRSRLGGEKVAQLLSRLFPVADVITDVRTVESGDDQPVSRDSKLGEDVFASALVRGRREREARHVWMVVEERLQLA